jgi:colanic acid biosynthesis glycosyl transferase WcaI
MSSGSMRILYISQYFPPEAGATQTRAFEMARNLVRLGHQVTMIAEIPNHPSGIIPPEYRGKWIEQTNLEGIDVIRVWVKTSPVKNFRRRILFYLSFMFASVFAGLFLARGHFDLVYATSPPLFVGASGLLISKTKRIPLVFEVRDLWPESAVALGELSNPTAIKWATSLEKACYTHASKIVVVTQGIRTKLMQRGIQAGKLALIPNGANTELFQFNSEARDRIRDQLNLEGKFIAIYAGIHGIAQGLETIVETARLLNEHQDVHFLLVGEGPKKNDLAALIRQLGLSNLTLIPEQPRHIMPAYLSAADVALVPLRKLEIFSSALPSKMFDAWACRLPVLLSVSGEARELLEGCEGGLFIHPEDPGALRDTLLASQLDPHLRKRWGENGRRFTEEYYSRQALAEKLAEVLTSIDTD